MRKMNRITMTTVFVVVVFAVAALAWKKRHEWLASVGAWLWGLSVSVLAAGATWTVQFFDTHQGTVAAVVGMLGLLIQIWAVLRGNTIQKKGDRKWRQ